jgi:hypothetical protein
LKLYFIYLIFFLNNVIYFLFIGDNINYADFSLSGVSNWDNSKIIVDLLKLLRKNESSTTLVYDFVNTINYYQTKSKLSVSGEDKDKVDVNSSIKLLSSLCTEHVDKGYCLNYSMYIIKVSATIEKETLKKRNINSAVFVEEDEFTLGNIYLIYLFNLFI